MKRSQWAMLVAVYAAAALVFWATPRFGSDLFLVQRTATPTSEPDATRGVASLKDQSRPFDAAPALASDSLGKAASDAEPTEPTAALAAAPAAETPSVEIATPDPAPIEHPSALAIAPAAEMPAAKAATSDADAVEHTSALSVAPAVETPVARVATPDPDSREPAIVSAVAPAAETSAGEAALSDSDPVPPPEKPVRLVSAFPSSREIDYPKPAARVLETPKECLLAEICIDDYLWSLYERTPKIDTNKVIEKIKKTVKKKGKLRTVTIATVKYVLGDFTWKDPIAAQRAGMSLKDYVIGGMDREFKRKLYRALRAVEDAGFMPGITSAFRDDYRQAIASGNKAASDSSYHGGSRRGGYGHGLAADLVSLKGDSRMDRYSASDAMWKWIDAHEKELGIGRPYRDRDPPHVGAVDGREYVVKRAWANVKTALRAKRAQVAAKLQTKKHATTARAHPAATKRASPAKPSKVSSLQTRAAVQR